MDFSWTEEQIRYKRAVIKFAEQNLKGDLIERDRAEEFSRDWWCKCANFGIQGLPFPEAYGGAEADILTTMLTMEGLGYACRDMGLIFGINAQMWSVQMPILLFGSEEQKERYLPRMIKGEQIGAHGMSEPGSGSDAYSLQTYARRTEGGYVLNGTKTFVTNAPEADFALVFASVDRDKGMWGITGFIIDAGTPGFRIGGRIEKMGLRTSSMAQLVMEECYLPDAQRLGPEGSGAKIFSSSMEWERSCILASQIGAMERQLEESIRYAKEREQFNLPIGKFQSVANRIVDMKLRLETSRLLLYRVAWLKSKGKSATIDAALAKLYLSESFVASSLDAIRIHGGYGYSTEFEIERDLRDAVGGTLYSGTSDIQRNIIARLLGL
jgi:alkylation response protein AidB-like acyl-CoA dehydrogenase